ncbi:MAG: hypothetical protein M5U26_15735 [Planctomycetota bacterium]|nr:hypothetical protein [Planctomycetota bacterium]
MPRSLLWALTTCLLGPWACCGEPVSPEDPAPAPALPAQAGVRSLASFKLPAGAKVLVVPLNDEESTRTGMIDSWQAGFVRRRLARAKSEGFDLVILEIDTDGGEVAACEEINKEIAHCGVPVVAFVRGKAFSGGALISLGCDAIAMEPGTQIGGAQAVGLEGDLPSDVREKARSMLVAMAKGLAERSGYPENVARGMVDLEVAIVETDDPKARFIPEDELKEWQANPGKRGPAPNVVGTLKPKGQILTLTAGDATGVGLASQIVADRNALLQALGATSPGVEVAGVTVSEKTSRFLSSPIWLVLFALVAIGGLIYELKSPGLGIGLAIMLFCLGLFFWVAFFANSAGLLEIGLFLLGAVLLGLELFVIPGFGVCGIAGCLLLLGSILLAFIPEGANLGDLFKGQDVNPFQAELLLNGLKWASITLLAVLVCIGTALIAGVRLPGVSRLALGREVGRRGAPALAGAHAGEPDAPLFGPNTTISAPASAAAAPPVKSKRPPAELVGKEAQAETVLRPAGKVRFEGVSYEATAEGEWIEAGAMVKILKVGPFGLIVRAV